MLARLTPIGRLGGRRPLQTDQRGFALLITITLLAFLVLLLVSLASLTRVETQVASNSQQVAQARQNALTALNIAIGQLQKAAGPDQRVTATADIAGKAAGARLTSTSDTPTNDQSVNGISNGLVKVQPGTRYWTGVWGNSNLTAPTLNSGNIYETPPSPVLLNWMVSGNETTTFNASTAAGTFGQITASNGGPGTTAPLFNPGIAPVLPSDATKTGSIKDRKGNPHDTVLLVGAASAGDNTTDRTLPDGSTEKYYDRYVAAPLVDIKADNTIIPGLGNSGGQTIIGRYAYWIGDEGVKAKYNLVDTYASYTSPTDNTTVDFKTREGNTLSTTNGALARYRLMAPQRNGIEGLVDLNYQANDTKVGRVMNLEQMRFAGSATVNAPAQQQRSHDLTTTSMGVLANTMEGGLRKDLTAYLTTGDLGAANNIIPTIYSPTKGPTWGLLKSYTDLATVADVSIRPASTTQMGIFPIVSDVRLLFGLKPKNTITSDADYTTSEAQALFCPLIVLTNPYNVPLRLTGGSAGALNMEFKVTVTPNISTAQFRGEPYFTNIKSTPRSPDLEYRVLSRVDSNGAPLRGPKTLLNGVKFQFPNNIILQPGKSEVFSITSNQVDVGDTATLTAGPPSGNTFHYYGKTVTGSNMKSSTYKTEDGANSAPIDIVFSNASGDVKYLKAIDIKKNAPGNSNIDRKPQAFVIGMFKANVNYPGDDAPPSATDPNRNRTLRPFADFNLRAVNNRRILYMFSLPPLYNQWLSVVGTAAQDVPTAFTQYLGTGAFWGRDTKSALHEARLFDLPTPPASGTEMSLLSLAQLQHADLTADDDDVGVGHQPGYAVGNSSCPPYLARDQTKQQRPDWYSLQTNGNTEVQRNYYDISYRLNCALWDKYFFSAIPQAATSYESVNPRYRFLPDTTLAAASSTDKATALHKPTLTARYMMVEGAFNINSTSIEGWKAVLGGSRGLKMPGDSQADAAFPRSVRQPGEAKVPKASGDEDDTYTGFRRLNDAQLTALATEIVKQVRLRGPFVSLAQFVNRTLTTTSASLALQGPLQTAIDSAAGGINIFTKADASIDIKPLLREDGGALAPVITGTFAIFPNATPPAVSEQGYRSTAAPGWLTQADLLQVIGPALSTRSDTFVIRTYGDVKNPLDASAPPISQAWCEAVVQRLPDYVDTSDKAEVDPVNLPAASINRTYGRRFKVVSFRWLTSNDI